LAFAVADPARNALPAAALLAAFVCTGSSFLAFAVMAERRGLREDAPAKGCTSSAGSPRPPRRCCASWRWRCGRQAFAPLAWAFAGGVTLTLASRLAAGWRLLRTEGSAAGARAEGDGDDGRHAAVGVARQGGGAVHGAQHGLVPSPGGRWR
jgi:hypothetical protein